MRNADSSGMSREMHSETFIEAIEHHGSSGTSAGPDSTPVPMLMTSRGNWMLMLHGEAFVVDLQQSGARGYDKFFSTNWIMPMAQRKIRGGGTLTFRAMLGLEPATFTHRFYPELFQTRSRVSAMAISQNVGTTITALLPALFAAVAPPGSADIPMTVGAITFGVTAIAAVAALSAKETYRIHLNELGKPDAVPLDEHEYNRIRAQSFAGTKLAGT